MNVELLVALMQNHPHMAIIISLLLNIIVAILGLIPSIFVTTANVLFFGFFKGFLISLLGEVLGALISFYLYRKGFKKISQRLLEKNKKLKGIVEAESREAFALIFSFRLFPYMPSGLVTYAAAIGKVDIVTFAIASTLGKIPSMVIEVGASFSLLYAVSAGYIKLVIVIISLSLIGYIIWKRGRK